MIRRIFAVLWIFVLAVLLIPQIVFFVASRNLFREESVQERVVPSSYESATLLMAEQFAQDKSEVDLFVGRVREMLPKENYVQLLRPLIATLFEELRFADKKEEVVLDLTPLKTELATQIPQIASRMKPCDAKDLAYSEFRLCAPTAIASSTPDVELNSILNDAVQKEIPQRLTLNGDVRKVVTTGAVTAHALPIAIVILLVVGGGILILITGLKLHRVIIAFSGLFVVVGSIMGAITFSFIKLPDVAPFSTDLTRGQVELIRFLTTQGFASISIISWILIGVGVVAFALGFFVIKPKQDVI